MRLVSSAWVLALAWFAAVGSAQPQRFAPREVESEIRAAYCAGSTAERVEFTYRGPDGAAREGALDLYIDPNPTGPRLGLRLGGLRAWAEPGRLVVADAPEGGRVWVRTLDRPIDARVLDGVLPPIVLPQLTSALPTPDDALTPGATSLTPNLTWELAQRAARSVRLLGRDGPVSVIATVGDGRWRAWTAQHDLDRWALELRIRPIAAGDVADWRVDTDGRERVERLDQLRPAPSADTLRPAQPLALNTPAGRPAAWSESLESIGSDAIAVFVLYRAAAADAGNDAHAPQAFAAAFAARLHALDALSTDGGPRRMRLRPVAVYELPEFSREALRAEVGRWDRRLVAGDHLFWSIAPSAPLEAAGEGASVVALAVDAHGRRWMLASIEAGSMEDTAQRLEAIAAEIARSAEGAPAQRGR